MKHFKYFVAILFLLIGASFASAYTRADVITVVVNQPTDANYGSGNAIGIVFTVTDDNVNVTDINAMIFWSAAGAADQNTHKIVDLNLMAGWEDDINTYCAAAAHFADGTKCSYTFDGSYLDGNFNIDINVYSFSGLAADHWENIGGIAYDESGNWQADNNAPSSLTISVPTAPRAPNFGISYTVSDDSPIRAYWVSTNGGTTYANNGTATTYTVTCSPGHAVSIYVKANDQADNNSSAATATVTCQEEGTPAGCGDDICNNGETASTCPRDCSAVCGDNACTHTESVETCPEDCEGCGDGVCAEDESCETCEADCGTCPIECVEEGNSIPVIAEPLQCCEGLTLIPPKDPTLVGIYGYCTAGCGNGKCDSIESTYNCPVDCKEETPPLPETECASDVECNDANPCTIDRCVSGNCSAVPVADGTSCGYGKECRAGNCASSGIITDIEQATGLNVYVIAIIVIIVIIAGYYVYSVYLKR